MASSSSSRREVWKYDVFLSFRGKDTRNSFTSHLYKELCRKGIITFKDDRELTKGEPLPLELPLAIDQSRTLLIIFSKNYATSTWCLEELFQISKRKEAGGRQIVLPIFYDVTPSDVRYQTGDFGAAFNKHEDNSDKVQQWRIAAKQIADLSGWELKDKDESDFIEEIVRKIIQILMSTLSRSIAKDFVGMESRLESMFWYLDLGQSDEVKIIGICGMGGIGKTTIASVVYKELSDEFEGRCFLEDVRETSEKYPCGLVYLQNQLLSATLGESKGVYDRHSGEDHIRHRLSRKKVLVILDDVSKLDQIKFLIGGRGETWFGPGSRIIITTRDESLLIQQNVDEIYRVKELNDNEALQLLRSKAIRNSSREEEYAELCREFVKYADGLPLALVVLGSSLYSKSVIRDWKSMLDRLKEVPNGEILSKLQISYDGLEEIEKKIFLDIACFFNGHEEDYVITILKSCRMFPECGMTELKQKSLITVSDGVLKMHDLLQEMGRQIVLKESPNEPGQRSRIWLQDDFLHVIMNDTGSEKVEGIFLDTSKIPKVNLGLKAFAKMLNLRLLKIYGTGFGNSCQLYLPDGLDFLSGKLSYLHWEEYPLSSMPSKFETANLVVLNLTYSKVEQLWSGTQRLVSLKEMNLSNCKNLLALPDLTLAKNLESLNFAHCASLKKVDSSIKFLDQLVDLDMRCCKSLSSLPTGVKLRSLKTLNLSGCSYLSMFPEFSENLTYLNLNETAIKELPESIGKVRGLITLNLKDCKQLHNLPESMHFLKALVIIDLSGCSKITTFPKICGEVKYLYLSGSAIVEIPSSIGLLSKLLCLDLMNCKTLKNLPSDISCLASLEQLVLSGCSSITKFPEVSIQVKKLCLDGTAIEEIPSSIQQSFELVELNLQNCTRLRTLPSSICKLKHLQKLNLSGCCIFDHFPEILEDMNSLRYLYLDGTAIKELPSPIQKLKVLSSLELKNCRYLCLYVMKCYPKEGLQIQYLRKLYLNNCGLFVVPHFIGCLSSLEALDLSGNPFIEITSSLKGLFDLQYLGVRNCIRLKSLPELPPNLTRLDAHGCLNLNFVRMDEQGAAGNIFEFIFTDCDELCEYERTKMVSYALAKFELYAERLYSQVTSIPAGESSFWFPGFDDCILYRNGLRFATEMQLPSGLAKNDFLGFITYAVIAFHGVSDRSGLRVKCKYHFQNENGDFNDFHCYFGGWYDTRTVRKEHVFVGYDPCDGLRNDHLFDKYRVANIELYLEDISGHPLQSCFLVSYGALCWTKRTIFGIPSPGFSHSVFEVRFPKICGELKYLYLSGTAIEQIPSSIGLLSKLLCLDLMNCKRLENLPSDVSRLASLEQLVLSGCSSITKFPEVSIQIKKLCFDGTAIEEIPSSIQQSFELVELNLQNCTRLCTLPSSICKLKHLQKLNLSGCCIFDHFPEILEDMNSLRYLYLDGTAIKELPSPIQKLKVLSSLDLKNCGYLFGVKFYPTEGLQIQYLRKLYLNNCGLYFVPSFIGCLSSLEALDLSGNPFVEITPSLQGLLELQYLGVRNCVLLRSLPGLPPNLTRLDAHGCLDLSSVRMDEQGAAGNIFEFIFTNCNSLSMSKRSKILSYAVAKFQLYAERLFSQVPSILAGESSFFIPRVGNHQFETNLLWSTGARLAIEIQLPSGLAKNDFLGFISCAFIAFHDISGSDRSGLRVKCKYHFQNENGDFSDLHCYFEGWYDTRTVTEEHVFVGYDPCDELRNDPLFDKYRVVNIELYLEDIYGHPLQSCSLVSYGALYLTKDTKFREEISKKHVIEDKACWKDTCWFVGANDRIPSVSSWYLCKPSPSTAWFWDKLSFGLWGQTIGSGMFPGSGLWVQTIGSRMFLVRVEKNVRRKVK